MCVCHRSFVCLFSFTFVCGLSFANDYLLCFERVALLLFFSDKLSGGEISNELTSVQHFKRLKHSICEYVCVYNVNA